MKRNVFFFGMLIIGLAISGCARPDGRVDNTASGAVVGGVTGAIIGSAVRDPAAGAAVGALVGGAVGHGIDQAQDARAQAKAEQEAQNHPPLAIGDIIDMSRAKLGDDLIISQIRSSGTVYHLKTSEILALKDAQVSEKVIDYMINTPNEPRYGYTTGNPAYPPPSPVAETVVVAPGPGYFWIDGAWLWLNGGWVWRHGYWHAPHGVRYGGYWHDRRW